MSNRWRIGFDIGGTFTDFILYDSQERPLVLIIPPDKQPAYEESSPIFRPGRKLEKPYWQQWWERFFGEEDLEELEP